MTRRIVEVEVSGLIRMEIDDQELSDFDGRRVLDIYNRTEGYTLRDSLAHMAYNVGILGTRDGLADFPDEAIQVWDFIDGPEFGKVTLDGKVIIS